MNQYIEVSEFFYPQVEITSKYAEHSTRSLITPFQSYPFSSYPFSSYPFPSSQFPSYPLASYRQFTASDRWEVGVWWWVWANGGEKFPVFAIFI